MVRRVPSKQRNARIHREADRGALARLAFLLLCGLILAGGFLYAGTLHFAALKYGYDNEGLRRERDRLVEEQRQFLLQREAAASPARLEKAARQLGMMPMQAAQIDPLGASRKNLADKKATAPAPEANSQKIKVIGPIKTEAKKTEAKQRSGTPK